MNSYNQNRIIGLILSTSIGALLALIVYILCEYSLNKVKTHFDINFINILIFLPIKTLHYTPLFAFVFSMGYAGYKIPKYKINDGESKLQLYKSHSLMVNSISWVSIIFLSIVFGLDIMTVSIYALIGFPIFLTLFHFTISKLVIDLYWKWEEI